MAQQNSVLPKSEAAQHWRNEQRSLNPSVGAPGRWKIQVWFLQDCMPGIPVLTQDELLAYATEIYARLSPHKHIPYGRPAMGRVFAVALTALTGRVGVKDKHELAGKLEALKVVADETTEDVQWRKANRVIDGAIENLFSRPKTKTRNGRRPVVSRLT